MCVCEREEPDLESGVELDDALGRLCADVGRHELLVDVLEQIAERVDHLEIVQIGGLQVWSSTDYVVRSACKHPADY